MGLEKNVKILDDIDIKNAYFKIKTTIIEWEIGLVKFIVGAWVSRNASKSGKPELPLEELQEIKIEFPIDLRDETKTKQYQLLKSAVSFFQDAEDVFEEENLNIE